MWWLAAVRHGTEAPFKIAKRCVEIIQRLRMSPILTGTCFRVPSTATRCDEVRIRSMTLHAVIQQSRNSATVPPLKLLFVTRTSITITKTAAASVDACVIDGSDKFSRNGLSAGKPNERRESASNEAIIVIG